MTYDRYCGLRSSYENEIKELKEKVSLYKQNQTSKEQQVVKDIIMQIEDKELQKIFGGSVLAFDISS